MRGAGIGSFFTNIFKGLIPLASKLFKVGAKAAKTPLGKSIINSAKKTAIDAGLDIAQDALAGENIGVSTKKRVKQHGEKLASKIGEEIMKKKTGGGKKIGHVTRGKKKTGASSSFMPKKKKKKPVVKKNPRKNDILSQWI